MASLLNTLMENQTSQINALIIAHLELDRMLYKQMRSLQIVDNSSQLSRLCGKNDSYFRCKKSRRHPVHVGSLVCLQAKLANAARKESDAKKALLFQYAVKSVADVIAEKCRLIEMEYHERELA